MKIKEQQLKTLAYFSIFIFAAFALTAKVLEVSAHKSVVIFDRNPDCAPYSYIAQDGYLPF